MNTVFLHGFVSSNPSISIMESGRKIAFVFLTTEFKCHGGQGTPETILVQHQLVAYDHLAERLYEIASEGKELFVEGQLYSYQRYGNNGDDCPSANVVIEKLHLSGLKVYVQD